MAQYRVTITPVPAGDGDEKAAHTAMRVIAEDGHAYLMELTVRAAENAKTGSHEVIQVDLDVLLRAFACPLPAAPAGLPSRPAAEPAVIQPAGRSAAGRAYRRMPEPAEVNETYLGCGTVAGVAERYGVPLHTAQGWVSRLRRKGILPRGR